MSRQRNARAAQPRSAVFADGRPVPLAPPAGPEPAWVRAGDHPADLVVREAEAPEPLLPAEADLGIPVDTGPGAADHRLVTIGDSLTMGFKSLAIADTALSWPALLAGALGLGPKEFTYPTYPGPIDCPGLPLNLEALVRGIDASVIGAPPLIREVRALHTAIAAASHVKNYWEHGPQSVLPDAAATYHHNLAVFGWTVRDAFTKSIGEATKALTGHGDLLSAFSPLPAHAAERAMVRALQGPSTGAASTTTMIDAAAALGDDGGIDTLVVMLGANNALPSAVQLRLHWTGAVGGPGHTPTVWTPTDFRADLEELRRRVEQVRARRVIWATVPHVTVAPVARGMGVKPAGHRYFGRYVHAWVSDAEYLPSVNPALTGEQAGAIDSAVDQYNYMIKTMVLEARTAAEPRDWLVLDLCGLLDRLAFRRYIADPSTRPSWWDRKAYRLPAPLSSLTPPPDTQFFSSDGLGRSAGGLIALDGVHPTTIGYAILAQEVFEILQHADPTVTGAGIDFSAALAADTLVSRPPTSLAGDIRPLHVINSVVDLVQVSLGMYPS